MYQQKSALDAFSNNLNTFNLLNTMRNQAKKLEIEGNKVNNVPPNGVDFRFGDMP